MTVGKIIKYLYTIPSVCLFVHGALMSLFTEKLVLPLGFSLPWTNKSSLLGFVINFFNQSLQAVLVVNLYICFSSLQSIFIMHIYCMYDSLCQLLDELDETLKNGKKQNSNKIKEKFVEIVEYHQNLLRFEAIAKLEFKKDFRFGFSVFMQIWKMFHAEDPSSLSLP